MPKNPQNSTDLVTRLYCKILNFGTFACWTCRVQCYLLNIEYSWLIIFVNFLRPQNSRNKGQAKISSFQYSISQQMFYAGNFHQQISALCTQDNRFRLTSEKA